MTITQAFHRRLFPLDDSKSPLCSTFLLAIPIVMTIYLRGATTSGTYQHQLYNTRLSRRATLEDEILPPLTSITSKWIHGCSTALVGMTATCLTLMVLVECTVRVMMLKVGIELDGALRSTTNSDHHADAGARQGSLAIDHHIERSLQEVSLEELLDDDDDDDELDSNDNAVLSCRVCEDDRNESLLRHAAECCAICLEEFSPGDTVVSGVKDCCKSNRFHKDCIHRWLRINDSCPCCRSPMIELPSENKNEPSAERTANTTHARYLRSQVLKRVDTATRLRNEVLTYFIDQQSARTHL
mmetsp:Transcript_12849/g.30346  ORF Transcript_12849/g.30346 Transcript_12849/m.30346 type:complete len:299 (+) Transcript_12849:147-1043(+)|eukprot:CAMPEP_0197184926 /NCGR_PEP_ID=MMETSP1423-20130617/10865_1 /TAXON_ID=476441 /ORGANISM="Pseudo-nitzschia heimii, Strain UNC1101" /LENGTH=298 /DNA_ID=CAMNT_0042635871 /DNA_START=99 /DNA_END=995 /DNA_ORIENTATION=-